MYPLIHIWIIYIIPFIKCVLIHVVSIGFWIAGILLGPVDVLSNNMFVNCGYNLLTRREHKIVERFGHLYLIPIGAIICSVFIEIFFIVYVRNIHSVCNTVYF